MSDESERKSEQIGRQQRGQDGRVQSLYADSELYEIVGQAARRARPDAPETLSLREFDRTLTSLGFPDAPSGRARGEEGGVKPGDPNGPCWAKMRYSGSMPRGKGESVRFHMSLDAEHKEKLDRMAEQAYTAPTALARSLLSRAIDDAESDGATMTDILLGIPGAVGRVTRAEEQLARGEGIPLDQL